MRITGAMLRKEAACCAEAKIFEREWPDGAEVTLENVRRAAALGLSLEWFVNVFFTLKARRAYGEAMDTVRTLYYLATQEAACDYDKATSAVRAAWADKRTTTAWAAFKEVADAARAAYKEATAPAGAAYDEARITAFFNTFELKGDQAV